MRDLEFRMADLHYTSKMLEASAANAANANGGDNMNGEAMHMSPTVFGHTRKLFPATPFSHIRITPRLSS